MKQFSGLFLRCNGVVTAVVAIGIIEIATNKSRVLWPT